MNNSNDKETKPIDAENATEEKAPEAEPPRARTWRRRKPLERLATCTVPIIMMAVLVVTEYQMKIGDLYTTESYLSIALVAAAFFIGILSPRLGRIWGTALFVLFPAAVFMLTEYFSHNPFSISPKLFAFNLIFCYAAALLLLALTGSMKAAIAVCTAVPMIFGIANYYVRQFRGNPLFPWDLKSIGIAADVADNYTFTVPWHVCVTVCAILFVIQLGFLCTPRIRIKFWYLRLPAALVCIATVVFAGLYVQSDTGVSKLGMYPYLFTPTVVYDRNGTAVTLAYTLQFTSVEKPDGYSTSSVEEIMDGYEDDAVPDDLPNVIVIMNEAFSDLRTAADYPEAIPVTPYIDALSENTVKGNLHVSVKGGNTANTEYEFLTGLSMLYMPPGSVPYQQQLHGETPNLASRLTSLGYTAVGMHPYGASGWNRNTVYKWFGFDSTYFSSDFKGSEKLRGYYTDWATYEKIINLYEEKDYGTPLFVFDVTMQNHGGYTKQYTDLDVQTMVDRIPTRGVTNTYLTLINKSDEAFGKLVEYFKNADEDTIILMFGDHQPNDNVVTPLWNVFGGKPEEGSVDEQLARYTVPFVMWANFDIEEETNVDTSANYLAALLCKKAGIPLSAYQNYLCDLMTDYPVLTAGHYSDSTGKYYDTSDAKQLEELKNYGMISYNIVTDTKNTLHEIFG